MKKLLVSILSVFLALKLSAQCTPVQDQSQWSVWAGGPDADHWQSFTAGATGDLSKIHIMGNGGVNATVTISVYAGQGVAGTLLYSGSHTFNQTGAQPELVALIPCDQMPTVVTGSQYTFRIQGGLNVIYNGTNPYGGGVYYKSGSGILTGSDMSFKTFVSNPNKPINSITFANPTCYGGTDGFITNSPTGGAGLPYIFNWSNGGVNSTEMVPAGTYTATATDGNGCVSCPTSVTVSDPPQVTIDAGTDVSICEGTSHTMVTTSTNATTYSWAPNTDLDNDAIQNPTATPTMTTNYSVTASDGSGCSATDNITVTILPLPTTSVTPDQSICEGDNVTLTVSGANSYTWDNGLGAGASHVVTPLVGTTNYTVVSTALNGCTKSDVVSITITPLPNVNAGLDASICEGESYTFNATSNATTYSWAPNTSLDDGSVLNPTATPTSTTNYTVTATDGVGCSATDDLNVTVLPLPVTTVTPNQDICDGDDVTLSASGADSYIWDNGLGAGSTHLVTPSIGVTTYTVVSTAINGCTVNDVVNINVNALPTVNAGPDISVCENEGVLFNATGANTYIWSSGANNGETVNYGPGNYNFTVTGADANGCENTDDFSFVVNSIPDLIVSDNQSFCKDDVVNLFVSGADTYDWDNGQSTGDNYQIQPTSSLNVTVKGIANGCEAEKIIELYYEDPGLISAGEDAFVCKGFSIDLSATGGQNYSWEGPNIENGNNQNVNVLVEESAYYYVTVMTEHCEYKDSVFIDLKTDPSCGIDYGNTISPNGDGVNDEWIIDGIDAFPNNRVVVYNRWGDIVFEGDNYDNTNIKWEGTQIDGSEATPGTYFYQIEIISGPSYSGWIELIR